MKYVYMKKLLAGLLALCLVTLPVGLAEDVEIEAPVEELEVFALGEAEEPFVLTDAIPEGPEESDEAEESEEPEESDEPEEPDETDEPEEAEEPDEPPEDDGMLAAASVGGLALNADAL
ncbi:MAG: hypothetical protein ACSW8J_08700, partial [bacterium]